MGTKMKLMEGGKENSKINMTPTSHKRVIIVEEHVCGAFCKLYFNNNITPKKEEERRKKDIFSACSNYEAPN